jgi:hypothetical protein
MVKRDGIRAMVKRDGEALRRGQAQWRSATMKRERDLPPTYIPQVVSPLCHLCPFILQ